HIGRGVLRSRCAGGEVDHKGSGHRHSDLAQGRRGPRCRFGRNPQDGERLRARRPETGTALVGWAGPADLAPESDYRRQSQCWGRPASSPAAMPGVLITLWSKLVEEYATRINQM